MRIGIVLGSSRPGRLGERVCRFVIGLAAASAEFAVLDLAEYRLPFFDEPAPPRGNPDRAPAPAVRRWLADVAAADGYLFLTPEYNHAVPAVLKNALDFLAYEAQGKPAAIVSYSDTPQGGNIAGRELRLTLGKLGMLPLPMSLPLAHARAMLDEDGRRVDDSEGAAKATADLSFLLAELVRYAAVLAAARDPADSEPGAAARGRPDAGAGLAGRHVR